MHYGQFSDPTVMSVVLDWNSKINLKELQLVQNAAVLLLSNMGSCEHITPVLQFVHWRPIQY